MKHNPINTRKLTFTSNWNRSINTETSSTYRIPLWINWASITITIIVKWRIRTSNTNFFRSIKPIRSNTINTSFSIIKSIFLTRYTVIKNINVIIILSANARLYLWMIKRINRTKWLAYTLFYNCSTNTNTFISSTNRIRRTSSTNIIDSYWIIRTNMANTILSLIKSFLAYTSSNIHIINILFRAYYLTIVTIVKRTLLT